FDRATGRRVHDLEVFAPAKLVPCHGKNSYASPTPLLDGDRVYAHFGPLGTACLSTAGQILWRTVLPHTTYYGPSGSRGLSDDLLIVPCHGTDVRYLAALDKRTGRERWRAARGTRNSESTPLLIRVGKADRLVCSLADAVVAYEPRSGKELWSATQ